jgi:hypothetical protein
MFPQGTDLYLISEMLGHSSVAITKDVYGHLVEGQNRAAAELMSAALLRDIGAQDGSQCPVGAAAALTGVGNMARLGETLAHPEGFEPPTF